jgi:hypothetical protein
VQPVEVKVNVIIELPADIPVNTPVEETMVPTAVLLLAQVPVPVTSLRLSVKPEHTGVLPVMAAGAAKIETVTLPTMV